MPEVRLISSVVVTHALDYSQFTITGDVSDPDPQLLSDAQHRPPSASDGACVVVLSPHQNNFAMRVEVEVWNDRPPHDEADWEQVSVESLTVDDAALARIGSPTLDDTLLSIPAGEYWIEVCGRGFVNYGWPGSTEPGDAWRLRLWPQTTEPQELRKLWQMPGFGTPWDAD